MSEGDDMSPAAKNNRESVMDEVQENSGLRDDTANLFFRGVERIAEVQKQFIDLAVQHNKEMLEVLKKAAGTMPGAPRIPMLDLAYGAVNRYADIQKSAVDFFVDQNRIWTDAYKDRTGTVKKTGESATRAVKQAMESSIAVQKKALEHTAAHTKAVVDAARNQFGFSGTQADVMTDTFRRGVDTIVEAQKELLNIVTH
jgi:hypothetical protein